MINVVLPFIDQFDTSDREPQLISYREPNTSVLRLDSRIRRAPQSNASTLNLFTNDNSGGINNPLIKFDIRRICIKKVEFFFYPNTVIEGYNDSVTFTFSRIAPPAGPLLIEFILPPDVYSVDSLGVALQQGIEDWLIANAFVIPVTYTFFPPTNGLSLDGQIALSLDNYDANYIFSIDPSCTFCKYGSFSINTSNTFPIATANDVKLSFYSLLPFPYIDIVSTALTSDQKLVPTNSSYSNNNVVYRMHDLNPGTNTYVENNPTQWININNNKTIYNIDLTFIDGYGQQIPDIKSRDCNIRLEILCQK